jgi:hypothetical protein
MERSDSDIISSHSGLNIKDGQRNLILLTIFILIIRLSIVGAEMRRNNRGLYFPKKKYVAEVLPDWSESRNLLPVPILEDDPGWVDLYWKCWELAFDHLRQPEPGTPFVSNYVDEAFNDNIFQWDTIFMVMFWRYAHHVFPVIQSFDNFYCRQHADGFICREIWEKGSRAGNDHHPKDSPQAINPPLFSWAEVEYYRLSGDKHRLEMILPVLEKYVEWLEVNRVKPEAKHGLYWQTGLGSGMDNTPQTGSAWVEMSAQMVIQYNDLAFIAEEIGQPEKAGKFRRRAEEISIKINQLMWDEQSGFYWNLDDNNLWQKCKTIGFSWTLLAGIPSAQQAGKLVAHLMDTTMFFRLIPFASLAAESPEYNQHGGYWLGSSWEPTTYQAIKGLERYGFEAYAAQASEKYLAAIYAVYQRTGTVWENYAPDFLEPGDNSRPDFVGWSACGPVALLIENILGLHADAIHNQVVWHLRRTDRHGIDNLVIGQTTLTLICEKRASPGDPANLIIKTNQPFTLITLLCQKSETIELKPGTWQVTISN